MSEVKEFLEEFEGDFKEFRGGIDRRIAALEKGLNATITTLKRGPSHVPANDPRQSSFEEKYYKDASYADEHKAAFRNWLRTGDTSNLKAVEAKALSVGSDPDGGYLTDSTLSERIITRIHDLSPIRQVAHVQEIGNSSLEMVIDDQKAEAQWVGETQSRPQTDTPEVGLMEIPTHELYASPHATQKILDDANINIEDWLTGKIGDAFAEKEGAAVVSGNGINKPRGFLTFDDGDGREKVKRVKSGSSGAVTGDGLMAMQRDLKSTYLSNAVWVMNRHAFWSIRTLKATDNQYLLQPGLGAGAPNQLLGNPVLIADDMPTVENGALSVALADWSRFYTIVHRTGLRVLRDPYTAKPYVTFYTTARIGGNVSNWQAGVLMEIGT